jgi:hypothetical protein
MATPFHVWCIITSTYNKKWPALGADREWTASCHGSGCFVEDTNPVLTHCNNTSLDRAVHLTVHVVTSAVDDVSLKINQTLWTIDVCLWSTDRLGHYTWECSLNPTEGSGHSLNSTEGSGHSLNSTEGSGHSLNPTEGSGHSLNPTEGSGHSLNPTEGSGHSLNPWSASGDEWGTKIGVRVQTT